MGDVSVVFDGNVLVQAAVGGHGSFSTWPTLPPKSENPAADCIGVANDGREFALWLSPHILSNTARVLTKAGVSAARTERYIDALNEIAESSDGGILEPSRAVHDRTHHENNLVIDLAAEVGALILVSDDTDRTSMSPWRGIPILRPAEFASRVDAMRRARRRR